MFILLSDICFYSVRLYRSVVSVLNNKQYTLIEYYINQDKPIYKKAISFSYKSL